MRFIGLLNFVPRIGQIYLVVLHVWRVLVFADADLIALDFETAPRARTFTTWQHKISGGCMGENIVLLSSIFSAV